MNEKRCYTVAEIQEILGVGRQSVYSLLKRKEFSWVQLDSAGQRNLPDLKGKFRPVAGSSGKSVTS